MKIEAFGYDIGRINDPIELYDVAHLVSQNHAIVDLVINNKVDLPITAAFPDISINAGCLMQKFLADDPQAVLAKLQDDLELPKRIIRNENGSVSDEVDWDHFLNVRSPIEEFGERNLELMKSFLHDDWQLFENASWKCIELTSTKFPEARICAQICLLRLRNPDMMSEEQLVDTWGKFEWCCSEINDIAGMRLARENLKSLRGTVSDYLDEILAAIENLRKHENILGFFPWAWYRKEGMLRDLVVLQNVLFGNSARIARHQRNNFYESHQDVKGETFTEFSNLISSLMDVSQKLAMINISDHTTKRFKERAWRDSHTVSTWELGRMVLQAEDMTTRMLELVQRLYFNQGVQF